MGSRIELTAEDNFNLSAYIAEPTGQPRGALVVVQEIFGVNNHIRSVADGFAKEGYLAIAPAFFDRIKRDYESGYSEPEIAAARELVKKIDMSNAMRDVAAAAKRVAHAGKVGIIGYCWGGTVAWVAAAKLAGLACAVAYYGGGIAANVALEPRVPVMLHWGERDHAIPLEDVRKVEKTHPKVISYVYPAGHGFNCNERESFDAEAAALARSRTLEFLGEHLG